MNYVEFFGFSHEPFALGPSVRGFYNSARHNAVLRDLAQPKGDAALFVLRGASGTGRTTVALQFLDQLSPEIYGRVYVDAAVVDDAGLRAAIRVQCGATAQGELAELIGGDGFEQLAIVIDHADRIDVSGLFAEIPAGIVVAIVDADYDAASLPEANVLDLAPLNARGAGKYIQDRLVRAGGSRDLFSSSVLSRIFELSGGNPARINELCTALLVGAANSGSETVGDAFLALLPEIEPSADVETAMEHLDEATMDLAAGEAIAEDAVSDDLSGAEPDDELGGDLSLSASEEEVESEPGSDLDAMLDDLASEEEAAADGGDADLDALMADLEDSDAAADVSEPTSAEDDAAALDLEIEQQLGDAATDADEDDLALDELIGAAEADEAAEDESSVADDLLGELDAAIQMPDEETTAAGDDVDLDAMLGELDADVDDASSAPDDEVDLDAMLSDLESDEAATAQEEVGAPDDDADLDALMADLDGGDAEPEGAEDDLDALMADLEDSGASPTQDAEDDVDLDALMADLDGGDDAADQGDDENVDIDALLGDLEADDAGEDVDQLLDELGGEPTQSGGEDDIDALLDQLDSREDSSKSEDDDDLDDLLSQIDQLQDG